MKSNQQVQGYRTHVESSAYDALIKRELESKMCRTGEIIFIRRIFNQSLPDVI